MEKISGIIPSSARVRAVEMKDAAPVRPGTPSFGRPEGVSSLKVAADKAAARELIRNHEISSELTTAQKAMNVKAELKDWRDRDAVRASVAADISDKFFIRNQKSEPVTTMEQQVNLPAIRDFDMDVSSKPSGFKTDKGGSFEAAMRPSSSSYVRDELFDEPEMQQPEGLYPKGSFIDRSA